MSSAIRTSARLLPVGVVMALLVATTTSYTVYNRPQRLFHPYDLYERGYLADPFGYEARNTFQSPSGTTLTGSIAPVALNHDVVLKQIPDKQRPRDARVTDYSNDQVLRRGPKSEDVIADSAVVYRKYVNDDYNQMPRYHGSSHSGYYGDSIAKRADNDYATRNSAIVRYPPIDLGTGWKSASTRQRSRVGEPPTLSGSSWREGPGSAQPFYDTDAADADTSYGTEVIGSGPPTSDDVVSGGPIEGPGGPVNGYRGPVLKYTLPVRIHQPAQYYLTPSKPWSGGRHRLEGKQALIEGATEETSGNKMTTTDGQQSSAVQPVIGLLLAAAYDPCLHLPDGNYPLTSSFHSLFPYVDWRCHFVKCAHRAAFIISCGPGTRNPPSPGNSGEYTDQDLVSEGRANHYCTMADSGGMCRANSIPTADEDGTASETGAGEAHLISKEDLQSAFLSGGGGGPPDSERIPVGPGLLIPQIKALNKYSAYGPPPNDVQ